MLLDGDNAHVQFATARGGADGAWKHTPTESIHPPEEQAEQNSLRGFSEASNAYIGRGHFTTCAKGSRTSRYSCSRRERARAGGSYNGMSPLASNRALVRGFSTACRSAWLRISDVPAESPTGAYRPSTWFRPFSESPFSFSEGTSRNA